MSNSEAAEPGLSSPFEDSPVPDKAAASRTSSRTSSTDTDAGHPRFSKKERMKKIEAVCSSCDQRFPKTVEGIKQHYTEDHIVPKRVAKCPCDFNVFGYRITGEDGNIITMEHYTCSNCSPNVSSVMNSNDMDAIDQYQN